MDFGYWQMIDIDVYSVYKWRGKRPRWKAKHQTTLPDRIGIKIFRRKTQTNQQTSFIWQSFKGVLFKNPLKLNQNDMGWPYKRVGVNGKSDGHDPARLGRKWLNPTIDQNKNPNLECHMTQLRQEGGHPERPKPPPKSKIDNLFKPKA